MENISELRWEVSILRDKSRESCETMLTSLACDICFEINEEIMILDPCGHFYCKSCI